VAGRRLGQAVVLVALALLPAAVPAPAAHAAPTPQVDDSVVVQISSPTRGQQVQGLVEIRGFAADTRSAGGSGLNESDIQLWLNDATEPRNLLHYAAAKQESPEAAAALGAQFGQSGFAVSWDTCSFAPGHYQLTVWVSSLTTPGARNLATTDVEVGSCAAGTTLKTQAGHLTNLRLQPNQSAFRVGGTIWADFATGVDARCSIARCAYGLRLRDLPNPQGGQNPDLHYSFTVQPANRTFQVRRCPPTEGTACAEILRGTSPAIRTGTATNRLAVVAQGNELRLFVNGQELGQVRDDQRPWGRIGWSGTNQTAAGAGTTADVEFSNFVVTTPGPVETLAAVLRGTS
jgi:hypothetical protein